MLQTCKTRSSEFGETTTHGFRRETQVIRYIRSGHVKGDHDLTLDVWIFTDAQLKEKAGQPFHRRLAAEQQQLLLGHLEIMGDA